MMIIPFVVRLCLDVVVCFCREMIHVAGGTDGGPGREEPAIVV